jgi:hypothetical protein
MPLRLCHLNKVPNMRCGDTATILDKHSTEGAWQNNRDCARRHAHSAWKHIVLPLAHCMMSEPNCYCLDVLMA